jgi:polysaccharide biosynthesis protein PslE
MVSRTPSNGRSAHTSSASSARDVLRVLFRHKGKMLAFFVGTLTLVVVGLIFYPRSYVSDARLFVRIGKESVSLDPTATLSQNVDVEGSRENEINSELEMLRSRLLLQDVVDRLGTDDILNTASEAAPGWSDIFLTSLDSARTWLVGDVSPAERAIDRLDKDILVSSPRKSNVILVKCRARDPQQAQRILQAFLDSYLVRHGKANRTPGSHEFFVDQSNLLSEQLEKANEELRDAKNKTGVASIEGQRLNVQAQANSIELAMLDNQRLLSASEAKIAALQKALAELPPNLVSEETEAPSFASDTMRNELYKLQIQEKDASARYTELHPRVIALRKQVEETGKIFGEQEARRSHKTSKLSVVHQGVHTELMAAQALAAGQRAAAQSLDQQLVGVQSKIRALNDSEFQINHLTRQTELLEANYRSYTNNREQARIDQALEAGRISNVNVVQPASFIASPASPQLRLTLILGLIVATLGSVAVAFIAELFDRSLTTPEQIEKELGIPVLFSVPRGARNDLITN